MNPFLRLPAGPGMAPPPQRKRVIIIGAGPTGMSAAFHLGEQSLLLERRTTLENFHDYSHDFPMGTAYGGAVGSEHAGTQGDEFAGVVAQGKPLYISCSSSTRADSAGHTLIHVVRWQPPDLAAPAPKDEPPKNEPQEPLSAPPRVRTQRPLLRGELYLGAAVVRIATDPHLVELADGRRFVYDKLVSAMSLGGTELLVRRDLPRHVRRDQSLRYWLAEHDVEVADQASQQAYGDLDEFAAGKRIAARIGQVMAEKYRSGASRATRRRLFEPRLVNGKSS